MSKSIVVLSRAQIEGVTNWSDPTAIISITDPSVRGPHVSAANIQVNGYIRGVLRLAFHDLDPARHGPMTNEKWEKVHGHKGPVFMTPEQAYRVANYVYLYENEVEAFVIHCEAGISRSAGVAAALCQYFKVDDAWVYKNHRPNAHVKSLVLKALGIDLEKSMNESMPKDPDVFGPADPSIH